MDDLDDNYPAMSDSTFVPSVHAKVRNGTEWVWSSLHSAVKFAWGVLLRECSGREAFTGEPATVCVCGELPTTHWKVL